MLLSHVSTLINIVFGGSALNLNSVLLRFPQYLFLSVSEMGETVLAHSRQKVRSILIFRSELHKLNQDVIQAGFFLMLFIIIPLFFSMMV